MEFNKFFSESKLLEDNGLPKSFTTPAAMGPTRDILTPYLEELDLGQFKPVLKSLYSYGEKIKQDPCRVLGGLNVGSKVVSSVYKYVFDKVSKSEKLKDATAEQREVLALGLTYGALRGMGYNDGNAGADTTAAVPKPPASPAFTKARSFLNAAIQKVNGSEDPDQLLNQFVSTVNDNLEDANIQDIKDAASQLAVEHHMDKEGYLSLLELAKETVQKAKAQ